MLTTNYNRMKNLVIPKSITHREYQSLDKYFNEIDKINLLSTEEEVQLASRIRQGDQTALERLTNANLRFVISVAKQYQNYGLALGDLINEGNIGLIIAAKRYDETRGFRFISYAVWWIRQSIMSAIAEHSRIVRLPYNQLTMMSQLYKAQCKLEQQYGRRPSDDELSEYMNLPLEKMKELTIRVGGHVSIDEPLKEEDERTLMDIIPNTEPNTDHQLNRESVICEIYESLKVLSRRERELLILIFGLGLFAPLPMEEVGERFNITKEHVGRLKQKALDKLRNCSNASILLSCLS